MTTDSDRPEAARSAPPQDPVPTQQPQQPVRGRTDPVRWFATGYRGFALTLIVLGWLGELAIILSRDFVHVEPAWTVVVATLALMYGTLLYVGVDRRHVGFQLVSRYLRRRNGRLALIELVPSLAISVLFTIEAINADVSSYQNGGTTGTGGFNYPLWLIYLVAPVFGGILSLTLLREIVAVIRGHAGS